MVLTHSYIQNTPNILSLGIKRVRCESNDSCSYGAKVANAWSHTSTSPPTPCASLKCSGTKYILNFTITANQASTPAHGKPNISDGCDTARQVQEAVPRAMGDVIFKRNRFVLPHYSQEIISCLSDRKRRCRKPSPSSKII